MDHKPFLVLADALTRRGIAVLRIDDRGFGKSTGRFDTATSEDFAADTRAAVAYLRSRPEIDAGRIGLIGHSEGGMIGPMVAVEDPRVAFVVMMAGPGVPTRELMPAQRAAVARTAGVSPEAAAGNEAVMGRVEAALAEPKDWDQAKADATRVLTDAGMAAAAADITIRQLGSPWYRWFVAYDPRPTLRAVRVPVLALNGDKDVQGGRQAEPAVDPRGPEGQSEGRGRGTSRPQHLFQTADTGGPGEYARIEETISPAALTLIADWVVKTTQR